MLLLGLPKKDVNKLLEDLSLAKQRNKRYDLNSSIITLAFLFFKRENIFWNFMFDFAMHTYRLVARGNMGSSFTS